MVITTHPSNYTNAIQNKVDPEGSATEATTSIVNLNQIKADHQPSTYTPMLAPKQTEPQPRRASLKKKTNK